MTLSDLEGQSVAASLFKCDFCAVMQQLTLTGFWLRQSSIQRSLP